MRSFLSAVAPLSSVLMLVTACSGNNLEPDLTSQPDSTEPNPPPPVPLDGRGGGVLAYTLQPGSNAGVHEIHAMNADGSGSTRIMSASIGLNHHEWSPDAHQIVAVGYYDGGDTWSIHVFDADGTNLRRLTNTAGVWDTEPSWSPEGTRIAFTRMFPSADYRSELWIMNADGSDQRWLGIEGFAAKWSPDGTRLLYVFNPRDNADIRTCLIDGSDVRDLLSTTSAETTPEWSPDGEEVVYSSDADGDQEIYVMDADGSNIRQLTTNSIADFTPRWSSDGSLIAFDAGPLGENEWEVYVINADGTNLRQITDTPAPTTSINPVWRPTFFGEERPFGEPILFASAAIPGNHLLHSSLTFSPSSDAVYWSAFLDDGPEETLFVSMFDGVDLSMPERLAHSPDMNDHAPAMSDDGSRVFFSSRKPYPMADSDSLFGIWFTERSGDSWSGPQPVVATLDSLRTVHQVSVARNGNLYFSGRIVGEVDGRLYRSENTGSGYTTPTQLTGCLSDEDAMDPFVDPDERFIIFAVHLRDDGFGQTDLYVSHWQNGGGWGEPVNLGQQVNTEHPERFPSVSRDGKYLFFSRNIGDMSSIEHTSYYWIAMQELESFRN